MFKRQFLPVLSKISHSQALRGSENESRRNWKQEIQGILVTKEFDYSNCSRMLYNVEEHLDL